MKLTSIYATLAMIVCLGLMPIAQDANAQGAKASAPANEAEIETTGFFPQTYRLDRHEKTWAASPFSREVLPPPPPEVKRGPDPWEDWRLSSVDRFGGIYRVGFRDKKNKLHRFKVGEENEDGIMISKVESNGRLKDTVIHLAGGSRTGTIGFDPKRLSMATKGAPAPKGAPKKAPSKSVARPHGMSKEQAAALLKQRAAQQKTIREHMIKANSKKPEPKRRSVVLPPK
jgi:hypothetical protein